MTARGMMGQKDLDDKIRLCVNLSFDSRLPFDPSFFLRSCITFVAFDIWS